MEPSGHTRTSRDYVGGTGRYADQLEHATRGLFALNLVVLEESVKRIGMAPLRALQSLQRLGPSLVTEMGVDLGLAPSSASRLSDRLADAGLISRGVAPHNRRATLLELTPAGQAILDDLSHHRMTLFENVTEAMDPDDRAALLRGTAAFTAAYRQLAAQHRDDHPADQEHHGDDGSTT
ncbi:MarR family transcriptional regulator [Mycolicibacterium aromaticivorans JS19b1 = JCM 16368]|uniref:MarR family transcriptional regulator n=1 Tax=Mycolicibacterium aromaticivorans JS19b1 = JCM 16368 TaxID=1440774 RepID=A0A064CG64_9MYCO|nr:MarR family winged helix-turn-helix transcriptional regulator [Mycolicibacterium aromaticivorans]KDE97752.1 MarR family transcriptional regulator [Mycolicibacterium aromaticivorans JS19b1 = JCM 16368]